MIKPEEINKQINDIIEKHRDKSLFSKKELKNARVSLKFLTSARNYLEIFPSEKFVTSEIDRLKKQIYIINEGYSEWIKNNTPKTKNSLSEWGNINNLPLLKSQLKTLRYIKK